MPHTKLWLENLVGCVKIGVVWDVPKYLSIINIQSEMYFMELCHDGPFGAYIEGKEC